jgi:hypothetical protein
MNLQLLCFYCRIALSKFAQKFGFSNPPAQKNDILELCKPGHFHLVRSINRSNPSGQRIRRDFTPKDLMEKSLFQFQGMVRYRGSNATWQISYNVEKFEESICGRRPAVKNI